MRPTPHDESLGVLFQNISAGVGIVLFDRAEHIVEGEVVFGSRPGSTMTWNSLTNPPREFTSTTSGSPLSNGRISQSWRCDGSSI